MPNPITPTAKKNETKRNKTQLSFVYFTPSYLKTYLNLYLLVNF